MLPLYKELKSILQQGETLHTHWLQDDLPLQDLTVSNARRTSLVKAMDITSRALHDTDHMSHHEDLIDLTSHPQEIVDTARLQIMTIQTELETMPPGPLLLHPSRHASHTVLHTPTDTIH